jgi:cytochrome c biogenesis protein
VKNKNNTAIDKIWDLFASIKFAVIIFALISLTSIVGTVLEQNAEPEKNILILSKLLGKSLAPTAYVVLDSLGFMSMYDSWWFLALLLVFASNLVICSLDRLPRIIKLVREPIRPLPAESIEKMSIKRNITLASENPDVKEVLSRALRKIGLRKLETSESEGVQVYAEKGNFTRLGVYITHSSILIILAGAIIGIFAGFKAYLNLPEGQTSSFAYKNRGIEVPLGFEIRLDNFEVDFYGTTDRPKDFKSWLTVLKNGREVMKKTIEVNDPLTYEGITFYQSSYGSVPTGINNGIFVLRLFSNDGKSAEINPRLGDKFVIPGTNVEGNITNFSPALSIDASGRAFTYTDQMVNPAAYIEFTDGGKEIYSGWLLKRYPQTWSLPDGNRVEFLEYWGVLYTGLQVRRDPGVFIVYLGCIIMSIGLYITFFMSHQRVWLHCAGSGKNRNVVIGATANKNRAAFERKIEKLAGILSAGSKGGK